MADAIAKKLVIDGVEVTKMYSYLFSENVLTYQKSPERSGTGAISNINTLSTFYVPRLYVEFNYISLKDYQFILRLINKPEFTIEYFDFESGKYIKNKFYLEPQQRQNINAWGGYFRGITSYVLSFIGTLNAVEGM